MLVEKFNAALAAQFTKAIHAHSPDVCLAMLDVLAKADEAGLLTLEVLRATIGDVAARMLTPREYHGLIRETEAWVVEGAIYEYGISIVKDTDYAHYADHY
jgi:hypothetical protein